LMNNDIEILSPDWLSEMIGHAIQEEVGAVGARLWYPDKTLQHGGVIMGLGGVAGHAHKHIRGNMPGYFGRACLQQSFSAVTAACLLVARSKYEEVCGLDEVNLKIAFNDVDFCLKLQDAGYRNVWTPYAEMFHHESLSRGQDDTLEKQERFMMEVEYMTKRWPEIIASDPAYSPNLSLDVRAEPFSIAWPPRWYSQSKQKA
ncbi:MAG: glycosyl transferase family 2, partial [Chlorobiaceae bacterium]|nr:glycosyl transferase family 2 [Chlorobiaceae bacterium]